MMDDTRKIAVLTIYYEHWGKDEIQARKVADGWKRTHKLLDEKLKNGNDTLVDYLKNMKNYMCMYEDTYDLWVEIVDIFLHDYGGCFESFLNEENETDEERLFVCKVLLEENLGISDDATADIIYDDSFLQKDVLSVDAIVALPSIHHKNEFWPWNT